MEIICPFHNLNFLAYTLHLSTYEEVSIVIIKILTAGHAAQKPLKLDKVSMQVTKYYCKWSKKSLVGLFKKQTF